MPDQNGRPVIICHSLYCKWYDLRPRNMTIIIMIVLAWVRQRRAAGIGVSTKDIRLKALQFAREILVCGLQFKASVG